MARSITIIQNEDLQDRFLRNRISLDNLSMRYECAYGKCVLAITGRVHVANLAYEKYVFTRVTFDNWATYQDYQGAWLHTGWDGKGDIFTIGFVRPKKQEYDVEFAICCVQAGMELWDNNYGRNYKFHLEEEPISDK
ncbi:protein phosphatase 1 regulatory subunit 3B-like [Styela clava]